MFTLLKRLSSKISDPAFKSLVDKFYQTNNNGFYVYSPPIKNFNAGTINYIVRYTGRPVLAQSESPITQARMSLSPTHRTAQTKLLRKPYMFLTSSKC